MTRITITAEAWRALAGTAPPRGALALEGDGYTLWLEPGVLARLRAVRGPSESYSETIVRMAHEERPT